jgi:hypothetical protein
MIRHPIGIRILKKYGPMIGRGAKSQSASRQIQRLIKPGERKIVVVPKHTMPCHAPSKPGSLYAFHVSDVEKENLSLITRITTNLWRLCGCVSHVTNKDTKN